MKHFHAFYENEGYGGDIIDVNLPCPDPDCTRPDRYVPADTYDDFTASDVLAAFIRDPMTYSRIQYRFETPNGRDRLCLTLRGSIHLTPEQAAALSPLFAPSSDG
jgi:hypothetical protein